MFVLSKGHAVAALASIYAELGYFDRRGPEEFALLRQHPERASRADSAGHPHLHRSAGAGPVPWRRASPWPARALPVRRLLHDRRRGIAGRADLGSGDVLGPQAPGQSVRPGGPQQRPTGHRGPADLPLAGSGGGLPRVRLAGARAWTPRNTTAFSPPWNSSSTAARNGKPTAIVCRTTKGHGAFSSFLNAHKVTIGDALMEQELALQAERRREPRGRVRRVLRPARASRRATSCRRRWSK